MKQLLFLLMLLVGLPVGKAVADTGKLYSADKMSSSRVTSVCQDNYGYIWVGTERRSLASSRPCPPTYLPVV